MQIGPVLEGSERAWSNDLLTQNRCMFPSSVELFDLRFSLHSLKDPITQSVPSCAVAAHGVVSKTKVRSRRTHALALDALFRDFSLWNFDVFWILQQEVSVSGWHDHEGVQDLGSQIPSLS